MDGGVSTHLEKLLSSQNPPTTFEHRALWSSSLLLSSSGKSTILQGHRDWLKAGANILTTVSYQCHFGVHGQDPPVVTPPQMEEMMKTGIRLAQEAAAESTHAFVVASSGCYGAALADGSEYTGDYGHVDQDGLIDFHKKKLDVFLSMKPDGVAIETIPSVDECRAVCLALKSSRTPALDSAFWLSMACKDGTRLNEGTPLIDALEEIRKYDPNAQCVHAVGINCCDSAHVPSLLEILVRDMAQHGPRRGIVIYPNSGEEWDASTESWKEGTGCADSDAFSLHLMTSIESIERIWKASTSSKHHSPVPSIIIGGCCRTTPASIAALRQRIDKWKSEHSDDDGF